LSLVAGLELRLQRGELGEGRIGIGLAVAAVARAFFRCGVDAVLAAAIGPPIAPTLAPLAAIRTIESFPALFPLRALRPVATRPLAALGPILASLAIAPIRAATALLARRLGGGGRAGPGAAPRRGGRLGRAGGCRGLALRTPLRPCVPSRATPLVRTAARPPDLDELRLCRRWRGFRRGFGRRVRLVGRVDCGRIRRNLRRSG